MLAEYEFREIPIHVFKTENNISDFPLKFHKQLELCYVLDGVLNVEIEGKKRTLVKGDLYLVFPNIPHAGPYDPKSCQKLIFLRFRSS